MSTHGEKYRSWNWVVGSLRCYYLKAHFTVGVEAKGRGKSHDPIG